MALYHFTAKSVSFGKGESAIHRAAYHARIQLHDRRNAKMTRDYAHKGDHAWSGIFAPKDAPAWTRDRDILWNNAEAAERQANGQPARNIEFAIPNELTREQQIRLVTDFCREQFARKGMIADANMHSDFDAAGQRRAGVPADEPRNDHVHVLLTMRRLDGDQFARTKTDAREWNSKAQLEEWRSQWARMGAKALQKAGFEIEAQRFAVGHMTLPEQRMAALERGDTVWAEHLDREPDVKLGAVIAIEGRGQTTERGEERRSTQARNAEREELLQEAKIIDLELERLKRQELEEARQKTEPAAPEVDAAQAARERGRFEAWANARRAELQSSQLDVKGEQGRRFESQQQALARRLDRQYGEARRAATAGLAGIAERQARRGLRRLMYRLTGRAARDMAQATRLNASLADMARREQEQRAVLAARQGRAQTALVAKLAHQAATLERRIDNARTRREQEGWVRNGGKAQTGEKHRRAAIGNVSRRDATSGRDVPDQRIDTEAEIQAVDAANDPGPVDAPRAANATHGPESGQGSKVPGRSAWTPGERAAAIEAERLAREERERGFDADPGREMDR